MKSFKLVDQVITCCLSLFYTNISSNIIAKNKINARNAFKII